MQSKWYQELSKASGIVMAHQLQMIERVIQNKKCKIDINKGTISFGLKKYKIQVLGKELKESNTWLWSWANDIFSEKLIKVAKEIKAKGKELGMEQFFTDKIDITEEFNGETISILSCEMIKENVCYYSIKGKKETLYLLIYDLPEEIYEKISYKIFLESILSAIKSFELDHKLLVKSMLEKSRIMYKWDENMLTVDSNINARINYEEIDGELKISSIENSITGDWIVLENTYVNKMTKHFTKFIDLDVVDLQIKYFGDEISIVVECDDMTYQVIKFEFCQRVEYETDANWEEGAWRNGILVKDMKKSQLGYSFQNISVRTSKQYKGMYIIDVNLGIFEMRVVCKTISSEAIKKTEYGNF